MPLVCSSGPRILLLLVGGSILVRTIQSVDPRLPYFFSTLLAFSRSARGQRPEASGQRPAASGQRLARLAASGDKHQNDAPPSCAVMRDFSASMVSGEPAKSSSGYLLSRLIAL